MTLLRLVVCVTFCAGAGACGQVASGPQDGPVSPPDVTLHDASESPDGSAGSIRRIQHVLAMQPGNQPLSASFTTSGGRALLLAAGSARGAAGGTLGISILIDGQSAGACEVFSNEKSSDKAFGSAAWLQTLGAGSHTLTVRPSATTTLDGHDFVDLAVV